jgi:hypothetical protein
MQLVLVAKWHESQKDKGLVLNARPIFILFAKKSFPKYYLCKKT